MKKLYFTDEERREAKSATAKIRHAALTPEQRAVKKTNAHANYLKNRTVIATIRKTPEQREKKRAYDRAQYAVPEKREKKKAEARASYAIPEVGIRQMVRIYGLTVEQYTALWESQGRQCAICATLLPLRGRQTNVDHDHATGRVRGILCRKCNIRLGFLEGRGQAGLITDFDYMGWP